MKIRSIFVTIALFGKDFRSLWSVFFFFFLTLFGRMLAGQSQTVIASAVGETVNKQFISSGNSEGSSSLLYGDPAGQESTFHLCDLN